jgi:CubicO group peptidase (beta-lactamase class C family)
VNPPDIPLDTGADVEGRVGRALVEAVAAGEAGLQVSVFSQGIRIVEVAAGWAGPVDGPALTNQSLFPVFSVTKGVVAAAVIQCVADGLLELDTPLQAYWPEFGRGGVPGKDRITLRHVLTHSAGLPQMPSGTTVEQMCDWEWMVGALADAEPLWAPGAAGGYHAYTYGWLLGEPLRRVVDGRLDAGRIVRDLVAVPAQAEDFWIGLPAEQDHRVVTLQWTGVPMSTEGLRGRVLPAGLAPGQTVFGREDVRRSHHLGAGAVATASSLAGIYDHLARAAARNESGFDHLLGTAVEVHRHDHDLVLGAEVSRGLGFRVGDPANPRQQFPFDAGSTTFGHAGAGGSLAWADPTAGTAFAINRISLSARGSADAAVQTVARLLTSVAGDLTT